MIKTEISKIKGSRLSNMRYFTAVFEYFSDNVPIGTGALTDFGTILFPASNTIYLIGATCNLTNYVTATGLSKSTYASWWIQTSGLPIGSRELRKTVVAPGVINMNSQVILFRVNSVGLAYAASFINPDGTGIVMDQGSGVEVGFKTSWSAVTTDVQTVDSTLTLSFGVESI